VESFLSLKLPNVLRLRLEEIEGRLLLLLSSSASVKTLALYICVERYREWWRMKRGRRIRMKGQGRGRLDLDQSWIVQLILNRSQGGTLILFAMIFAMIFR